MIGRQREEISQSQPTALFLFQPMKQILGNINKLRIYDLG